MKEVESRKSKVQRRVVQKFIRISGRERKFFIEALVLQLWVGLLLKVIPFKWIPWLFASRSRSRLSGSRILEKAYTFSGQSRVGSRQSSPNTEYRLPNTSILTPHSSCLNHIRTATQRASRISPWKNKCLVSSLAARRMLNKRKILSQISLGVVKSSYGNTIAHAWLKAGDFEIVEKRGDYQELYIF